MSLSRYYPLLTIEQAMRLVGDSSSMSTGENADPGNCTDGVQWIYHTFGDCVSTRLQILGFAIGFISLVLWLVPLFPQLLQNYQRKRCDGLALQFMIFWMVGDTCNLLGAWLTNQTFIQKLIGIYYILQDWVLMSQYIYYTKIYPKKIERTTGLSRAILVPCVMLSAIGALTYVMPPGDVINRPIDGDAIVAGRKLLGVGLKMQPIFNGYYDKVGYAIGSIAALCYFAGRIPQMYKNYKRKSLEGLSLTMFLIIISANLTYGMSVILESDGWLFIVRHLPWLFSSLGCCFFDVIILGQFFYYRNYDRRVPLESEQLIANSEDDEGSE